MHAHRVTLGLWVTLAPSLVRAAGQETFGNAPAAAQKEWRPGVEALVNLPTRVYSRWINGNESFYFGGGTADLEKALSKFAAVDAEEREVVIRPGPGLTRSFEGKPVSFDWEVQVPSGIYLARARKEKLTRVFAKHAMMFVYPRTGGIELGKLKVPAGVKVLGIDDLKDRYAEAFTSDEPELRGMALTSAGELTPLASDVVGMLARGLEDRSEYVRRSAAGALSYLGPRARGAEEALKKAIEVEKEERVRETLRSALAAVEAKPADPAAQTREDAEWAKGLEAIRKFLEKR